MIGWKGKRSDYSEPITVRLMEATIQGILNAPPLVEKIVTSDEGYVFAAEYKKLHPEAGNAELLFALSSVGLPAYSRLMCEYEE